MFEEWIDGEVYALLKNFVTEKARSFRTMIQGIWMIL